MFVYITTCSEHKPSAAGDIYLILLSAAMMFFAFQNMKLTNHFRLEGQATCMALAVYALLYIIYTVTIRIIPMEAHYYRVVFRLTLAFFIVIAPTALIIIFMPKVKLPILLILSVYNYLV